MIQEVKETCFLNFFVGKKDDYGSDNQAAASPRK